MRSIWSGSVKFMVLDIPAKMYSACDDKPTLSSLGVHQIHTTCGNRITAPKFCDVCQTRLDSSQIKKAYQGNGGNVVIEESDLASLPLKSIKTIEITEFVDGAKIDARCYTDSYFISPEASKARDGTKLYTMLLRAMEIANLVAIGKLTYRDKEHLVCVRPYYGVLLLQTLHYASELRPFDELIPKTVAVAPNEMELIQMLVTRCSGEFDINKYHDDYTDALLKMVEAKASGTPIAVEATAPPVSDVAEALLKSLQLIGVK